jgi:VIT1/CCC1 family predicted Fe2+/Mn2+ transporter
MQDKTTHYLQICLWISGILLFVLGFIKAEIIKFDPWKSAVETLVLGGVAVGVGYCISLIFD